MSADMTMEPERPTPGWMKLLAAVVAVAALAGLVRSIMEPAQPPTVGLVGQPAPLIQAQGWLNGEPPTEATWKNQVIVVDAWAYWCKPCFLVAPELVKLHKEYSPRGVMFVGLTTETTDFLSESQTFLEKAGITWLNGYGAFETLTALEAHSIPRVWVIDRTGTITWDATSQESIESALERALRTP